MKQPHRRRSRELSAITTEPYFTNPDLAAQLVRALNKQINLRRSFDAFVEPAAGFGAFVDVLHHQVNSAKVFAYDVRPNHHSVRKADFLKIDNPVPSTVADRRRVLCIGNVPFGSHAKIAGAFLQKCATFSDHLAFVLPIGFLSTKYVNRYLPPNYHIVWFKSLRNTEFKTLGNQSKVFNVAFVYFRKLAHPRRSESQRKKSETSRDFEILIAPTIQQRKKADIRVRGTGFNAGEAFLRNHSKFFINKQRSDDWFITLKGRARNLHTMQTICKSLNKTKWTFHNLVPTVKYLDRTQLEKRMHAIVDSLVQ